MRLLHTAAPLIVLRQMCKEGSIPIFSKFIDKKWCGYKFENTAYLSQRRCFNKAPSLIVLYAKIRKMPVKQGKTSYCFLLTRI